jgi:hypothetical protein
MSAKNVLEERNLPTKVSTKEEAFNCLENLLILDEISVDKYEILVKVIDMFGIDKMICLGDGIFIKLVDEQSN